MVEINEVEFAWWLLRTGAIQCCEVNGRVEREIETVRGLARTLISHLKNGAKSEINTYGPIFQWAMMGNETCWMAADALQEKSR